MEGNKIVAVCVVKPTTMATFVCVNHVHKNAVAMLEINVMHKPNTNVLCTREQYSILVHLALDLNMQI